MVWLWRGFKTRVENAMRSVNNRCHASKIGLYMYIDVTISQPDDDLSVTRCKPSYQRREFILRKTLYFSSSSSSSSLLLKLKLTDRVSVLPVDEKEHTDRSACRQLFKR